MMETRTTECANQEGKVYDDEYCQADRKPELQQECLDVSQCEYSWFATQWSDVSGLMPQSADVVGTLYPLLPAE